MLISRIISAALVTIALLICMGPIYLVFWEKLHRMVVTKTSKDEDKNLNDTAGCGIAFGVFLGCFFGVLLGFYMFDYTPK